MKSFEILACESAQTGVAGGGRGSVSPLAKHLEDCHTWYTQQFGGKGLGAQEDNGHVTRKRLLLGGHGGF